jgi:hypothetical protein
MKLMEETVEKNQDQPVIIKPARPFLLSLVALFSFVFHGFISLLFLFATFYSGWIFDIVIKYMPQSPISRATLTLYILAGFFLHACSFTGTFMIWKMKRAGYILFSVAGLIIASYQLFQTRISFLTTGVYILLIIIFGLFYKKLH